MLKLYNSLSLEKEVFKSFDPDGKKVRIYVCGVTPYDTSHMGHALVAVVFDVLRRYLTHKGYDVTHIQNVTDVDDDLFKRANRDKVPYVELAQHWDQLYRDGLAAINCLPFDKYVPASTAIDSIKRMVSVLVAKKAAYQASDGNVYFRAASFPAYGELSHLPASELLGKARAAAQDSLADQPGNPAKESELDFILWQATQPGEPAWESDWGLGRPGWHIECSAISLENLGEQFEIHGGGADLIFPHHSSEIAQTETVTGQSPSVRHWMHVAMLYLEGEKMSKSLGNLILIKDALKTHSADALRLYLLGAAHYRAPLHFVEADVAKAEGQADTLRQALEIRPKGETATNLDYKTAFYKALDDDFNAPKAVALLVNLASELLAGKSNPDGQHDLRHMARILGLPLADAYKL